MRHDSTLPGLREASLSQLDTCPDGGNPSSSEVSPDGHVSVLLEALPDLPRGSADASPALVMYLQGGGSLLIQPFLTQGVAIVSIDPCAIVFNTEELDHVRDYLATLLEGKS